MRIVVMGVSAAGKSTVAAQLAMVMGIPWRDADDLHPGANVAKMASGIALTDDDRWPWLDRVGVELAESTEGMVIACSALRRAYRDRIRAAAPDTVFAHLTATDALLVARAAQRPGHFMPGTLMNSQLTMLEPLSANEIGLCVDVSAPITAVVNAILDWVRDLGRRPGEAR